MKYIHIFYLRLKISKHALIIGVVYIIVVHIIVIPFGIKSNSKIPTAFKNKTDIWKQNISNGPTYITFIFLWWIYTFLMLQNSPFTFALIIFICIYFWSGLHLERHAVSAGPACLANCIKGKINIEVQHNSPRYIYQVYNTYTYIQSHFIVTWK